MPKPRRLVSSSSRKVPLHTTISGSAYNKLLDIGNGALNTGIESIVDLMEKKQYVVKHELERIANHVLSELSRDRRDDMKTFEDLQREYDLAQRIVLEKTIEITLFNQGIDPGKVPMRDFDRLRRVSMEIDAVNDKTNEKIEEVRATAQTEINALIEKLEAISIEIKTKIEAPEEATPAAEPVAGAPEAVNADGNSQAGDKQILP